MFRKTLEKICLQYGFYPRKYQLAFAEVLDNFTTEVNKPVFVRLPCGYGKTLLGLLPLIGQYLSGNYLLSPRLIYVLPTRALVNFFAKTARQLMDRIKLKINVDVEHGEIHTSPHYLSSFIITTLDTFFYVYTKKLVIDKHLEFPAGCIATSTVVFDEAHMYQGGEGLTFFALKKLINHLADSSVPIIVMTATMPESLKKYLLEDVGYIPIEYGSLGLDEAYESKDGRKEYDVEVKGEDEVNIVDLVSNYKRALVVLNTVSRAQRVYSELKDRFDNVLLLHSRLCRSIREKREERIHDLISKGENMIIVSTQVCESGLDYDSEILITEAAPSDALTQRVGRCARRGGFGKVVIVKPKSSHPYNEQHLLYSIQYVKNLPEKERGKVFSIFTENMKFINLMNYIPREENKMARELKSFMDEWLNVAEEPPENLDLKIRETNFITALHMVDHDLYVKVINSLKHKLETSLIELNTSIEYFKNLLRSHTFTLDMNILFEYEDGSKVLRSFLLHEVNGEKFTVKVSYRGYNGDGKSRGSYIFTKDNRILPYNIYLVNSEYCSDEVGLRHDL